jgi:uncharacterized protein (DUF952 family)
MRLLHLALASDWERALDRGSYDISTRGATVAEVGFLHASFPEQLAATAARFYADVDEPLVVLVLRSERLEAAGIDVRLEDVGGETFPHVYAALPVSLVDDVRPATITSGILAW